MTLDGGRPGSGALLALVSMTCVQLGLAASVGLFAVLPPQGVVALRLAWAGVVLLVVVRPRPSAFTASAVRAAVGLGVVTAGMSTLFIAAVARIPLGTASAVEFLGPLTVAVLRGRGRALLWPLLAATGVLLLTEPWHGGTDLVGVALASGAAACWAGYILLTWRVGDTVTGLQGLAVSMPVAGVVSVAAAVVLVPDLGASLSGPVLLTGLALALLLPVVPFALEMLALRRLPVGPFGTLMALEPAIALLVGAVALRQVPSVPAVVGIVLVVAAGVGAARVRVRAPDLEVEVGPVGAVGAVAPVGPGGPVVPERV